MKEGCGLPTRSIPREEVPGAPAPAGPTVSGESPGEAPAEGEHIPWAGWQSLRPISMLLHLVTAELFARLLFGEKPVFYMACGGGEREASSAAGALQTPAPAV